MGASSRQDGELPEKAYDQASVFQPANLLREARRQRALPDVAVPSVCLLDPDGDIATYLEESGLGTRHPGWACYHTDMWVTQVSGISVGVVGRAVGASFAVLVAEHLFARGAELVIVATEWREFRDADPVALASIAAGKIVIDGRNCLNADAWADAGWVYRGLGRRSS